MLTKPRLLTSGWRRNLLLLASFIGVVPFAYGVQASAATAASTPRNRDLNYHGYQISVPRGWRLLNLASHPDACVRFDSPTVYLGKPGGQPHCPAHLIGGAPALTLQPLTPRSAHEAATSTSVVVRSGRNPASHLPSQGPVSIAVERAGVLVTAYYGAPDSSVLRHILAAGQVSAGASRTSVPLTKRSGIASATVTAPGSYAGRGFDTCAAPSPSTMRAWRASSPYRAVGVYIGGVNRGCSQPNLTASWVSTQVKAGWHLIPTYVGLQAPCSGFYNRVSYNPSTARSQGRADGKDAVSRAKALGIAAPSVLYADMEGYNNTNSSCVRGVLSYLTGWASSLHAYGYRAGVYSSAASGMSDLSTHYNSSRYRRPDDIWLAWWNRLANVDGGTYVPDSQWANHQRIHQYVGNVTESYGGYRVNIDRDYLDVGSMSKAGQACPTKLNFAEYSLLQSGDQGPQVAAAQCLLLRQGFDPGSASGKYTSATAAAVRAFKASRDLNKDSVLGRRGWTALLSAGRSPALQLGSTGAAVGKLQRALTASLQRTVTINGSFDRPTRRAVMAYQNAHGLTATGKVGRATWKALHAGL